MKPLPLAVIALLAVGFTTASGQTPQPSPAVAIANMSSFAGSSVAVVEASSGQFVYRIDLTVRYQMGQGSGQVRAWESFSGASMVGVPVNKFQGNTGFLFAYVEIPVNSPVGILFAAGAELTFKTACTEAGILSPFHDSITIRVGQ